RSERASRMRSVSAADRVGRLGGAVLAAAVFAGAAFVGAALVRLAALAGRAAGAPAARSSVASTTTTSADAPVSTVDGRAPLSEVDGCGVAAFRLRPAARGASAAGAVGAGVNAPTTTGSRRAVAFPARTALAGGAVLAGEDFAGAFLAALMMGADRLVLVLA